MRRRRGRKRATGMRTPMAVPDGPNQPWSLNFVAAALSWGRRVRILCIVDDFTREALALAVDTLIGGRRMAREVDALISRRGKPALIHADPHDRGYDADWFRAALIARGIEPCILPRARRRVRIDYDNTLYRQRHRIENMFGRLKDWWRIHTRYDRCAHTFTSAIPIAATVIF